MNKLLLSAVVFLIAVQSGTAAPGLKELRAADAAALELALPLPARPAPAAPADAQLLQRFDLVRNQLRSLKAGGDAALYEMRRLESEAYRISAAGAPHLSFQSDMLRLSSDLSRRAQETRNAYYAVVNLLPFARKDRELGLRSAEIDSAAASLAALENAARRLEGAVAAARPEAIGYAALVRAREISRQAEEVCDQGRELRAQTAELVRKTRP